MVDSYWQRCAQSSRQFERAQKFLAGGVSHESRYVSPFPIYANWAKGSRKRDIDGNEYIDYSMGSASLLLGHSHPSVVEALKEQVTKGTFYANCHPLEIEWAARVQDLVPSAERVRFVSHGLTRENQKLSASRVTIMVGTITRLSASSRHFMNFNRWECSKQVRKKLLSAQRTSHKSRRHSTKKRT